MLAFLSDSCLCALSQQVAIWERTLLWPTQEQEQITTLIPKQDGGLRPIALFRTIFRVVGRIRADACRSWSSEQRGAVYNNGGNRQIGDSTWREQTRSLRKEHGVSAELLVDLKKAFEHVDRRLLFSLAASQKYPSRARVLSLTSYRWDRRAVYGRHVSRPIATTRGIAAGSPFAAFELWMCLGPALLQIYHAHRPISVALHVDDLSITVHRTDSQTAAVELEQAVNEALGLLCSNRSMVLAADKSFLLLSDSRQAQHFDNISRKWSAKVVSFTKRLGVQRRLGRVKRPGKRHFKRTADIMLGRFAQAKQRLQCLSKQASAIRADTVMRMGVSAVIHYGAEFGEPPKKDLAKLQSAALRRTGLVAPGIPLVAVESLVAPAPLPEFLVYSAPLIRWHRELWALQAPRDRVPEDVLTGVELHELAKLIIDGRHEGPLGAIQGALRFFRWRLLSALELSDDRGCPVHLSYGSPGLLRRLLLAAYTRRKLHDVGRRCPVSLHGDWNLLVRIAHSQKLSQSACIGLSALFFKVFPHLVWQHRRGLHETGRRGCGSFGTLAHVLECPEGGGRGNLEEISLRGAPLLGELQGVDTADPPSRAWVGTREVALGHAKVVFDPSKPVYIDGSAKGAAQGLKASAAAAVVQLLDYATAVAWSIQVPRDLPQTAHFAERYAVGLLTTLAESVHVSARTRLDNVTDCASVVKHGEIADSGEDSLVGGLWRSFRRIVPSCAVHKARAHVPQREWLGESLQVAFHYQGNATADRIAKQSHVATLCEVAPAGFISQWNEIGHWLRNFWRQRKQHVYARRIKRLQNKKLGQQHAWVPVRSGYRCSVCGASARAKGTRPSGRSQFRRLAGSVHNSRKGHTGLTETTGTAEPLPFAFCVQRGGYGSARLVELRRPCPGAAQNEAERKALCRLRVPKTLAVITAATPIEGVQKRVLWDSFQEEEEALTRHDALRRKQ
jgi:hypothetical protein